MGRVREVLYPYHRIGVMERAEHQKGSSTSQGAPASADDAVAFKDSDMWTAVKCGTGSVSLESKKTGASTVAIVDLGENATNAKVQLHWVRSEVPDFAMPFYLSGGLLAVLAVLCASVFAMPPHKRRKRMVEGTASAVIEEEAPASIAVSGKPDGASRRNRRRHATHRRSGRASSQSEANETPVIIDPSSRNLVADQQTGAESGAETGFSAGDNESTSVITPDELQAYFSRLAQEVNTGDDSADDGQEES